MDVSGQKIKLIDRASNGIHQNPEGDVMSETVWVGRGRQITRIPRRAWEEQLAEASERIGKRLDFMSDEHHLLRNFVVRELPRLGRPISLSRISETLRLSLDRTAAIVDELEKNRFFLVRGDQGEVSWAFPVTVDETGHHLIFSTGERLDAA